MKKSLLLILISVFAFAIELSAQNLLEVALQDMSQIVYDKPVLPKLPIFIFENEFFIGKNKSDSLNIRELMSKIDTLEIDYEKWTKEEMKNRILVSKNKKIDLKLQMLKISDKPKEEQKKLKKEIKSFNSNKNGWRSFPLYVSRPIITNDKKLALITIIRGNSGGSTILYKFYNEKWNYFEYMDRWAY